MQRATCFAVVFAAISLPAFAQSVTPRVLSDKEINEAIDLGKRGIVPLVQVSRFTGDFKVSIEDPVSRIAAGSARAFREYRPFSAQNVTAEMKSPLYRVFVESERGLSRAGFVQRIVLQPKGPKGIDGVVQPVKEGAGQADFDRFPEGEFDVVVIAADATQKYGVSLNDRAKFEPKPTGGNASATATTPRAPERSIIPSAQSATRNLRLLMQGDGEHLADAIRALQRELATLSVIVTLVQRGEPYDYTVIFGEGDHDAASVAALDANANVIAVAVRGAFTEKGAVEGAIRDLVTKLAPVLR